MIKCEKYDNWCEKEKRVCKGCFHNKYIYVEKAYLENLIKENEEMKERINFINMKMGKEERI